MPPLFTDPSLTAPRIIQIAQGNYRLLISALELCVDYNSWIAQFAPADLVNKYQMDANTAQELLTSAADSNSFNNVFNGGAFAIPYNFSNSIRQVTGPIANGS